MKIFAKIRFFFIIPMVFIGFFSCDPNEKLPPGTTLDWIGNGVQYLCDSAGLELEGIILQVSFQSGEGNIGSNDTAVRNLFVHVFDRIITGTDTIYDTMKKADPPMNPDNVVIDFRVPMDIHLGKQGPVKGTFDIGIYRFPDLRYMQQQTKQGWVRFEIYMLTQDLKSSDTICKDIYILDDYCSK